MIVDLDRIPENGLDVSKEFEVENDELVEENSVFLKPVYAEFQVKKIGEEIFIKGKISTELSFICSRCLSPYEYLVDSNFDLVYLPEELNMADENLESEDLDSFFYHSRKIDLKDVILEQLNLTIPLRPLCNEDCQGICPVCGKIIKTGECSCIAENLDSRLEKLKIFLRDKR